MIQVILNVVGSMSVFEIKTGIEISETEYKKVLEGLEKNTLLLGFDSKTISALKDLSTPLYKVSFDVSDSDYTFEEH